MWEVTVRFYNIFFSRMEWPKYIYEFTKHSEMEG